MSGLLDYILAYALTQGAHTGGHFSEASKSNVPMKLDLKNFGEIWKPVENKKKNSKIDAAGFESQEVLSETNDNRRLQGKLDLINGLSKILYPAIVNQTKNNIFKDGDIGGMTQNSGNKQVKNLLLLSALSDIYKSQHPDQKWRLSFHAQDGNPGLLWRTKF